MSDPAEVRAEVAELFRRLDVFFDYDVAIYPKTFRGKDGVEHPRTEREEGWNAAVMAEQRRAQSRGMYEVIGKLREHFGVPECPRCGGTGMPSGEAAEDVCSGCDGKGTKA